MGIDADNDLLKLSDRVTIDGLRWYGRMTTLLNEIGDTIALLDCPGPVAYVFAGGIVFGAYLSKGYDIFDLSIPVIPFKIFAAML